MTGPNFFLHQDNRKLTIKAIRNNVQQTEKEEILEVMTPHRALVSTSLNVSGVHKASEEALKKIVCK